ncbi:MAG: hypothetical protein KC729_17100, partial [Candidatus Eisenbacteria bacterium]|nr:hypothetical protein [Candidatus Eisenbacteria bacterium]
AVGSASFVVSPMEHHLTVAAGKRGPASLVIRNTGTRPLSLKLYLADSQFEVDGHETEVGLGSLSRSCAPWVEFSPELVELAAGEVRTIFLEMAPPIDAQGSYWTKLYIEEISTPEPTRQEQAGRTYQVFMRQRMGVRIFEEVPGTSNPGMLVENVRLETSLGHQRTVVLTARNTGNALLHCTGWMEVRNSLGEIVEIMRPTAEGQFTLFPGGTRDVSATSARELTPDTYTILAVVDYGGDTLVAGEEILELGPRAAHKTAKVATR